MEIDELISKYPKIFQDYEGNPGKVNWSGIPKGWINIIDTLCGTIQNHIDNKRFYNPETKSWERVEQVRCVQMKQKFGKLRFYTDSGNNQIEGMIEVAEYMSGITCEDCGTTKNVGKTSGWISTLCQSCAIANGDRAMNSWKPNSEQ